MYSLDFRFHWEVLFAGMVTVFPTFMKFSVRVNIYCIARDTFWPWPCSDLVLRCTVSKIIPGGQIEDHIWTCSPVHTLAVSSPWFISRMPQNANDSHTRMHRCTHSDTHTCCRRTHTSHCYGYCEADPVTMVMETGSVRLAADPDTPTFHHYTGRGMESQAVRLEWNTWKVTT